MAEAYLKLRMNFSILSPKAASTSRCRAIRLRIRPFGALASSDTRQKYREQAGELGLYLLQLSETFRGGLAVRWRWRRGHPQLPSRKKPNMASRHHSDL